MSKYKIRCYNLTTRDWDEYIVDADNLINAEEMAREEWFNVNEVSYTAELLDAKKDTL